MNDGSGAIQKWLIALRLQQIGLGPFYGAGPAWTLRGACDGVPPRLAGSAGKLSNSDEAALRKDERITLGMSLPTLEQQLTCRFLILEQNVSFMSYLPFPVGMTYLKSRSLRRRRVS